jgi:hypothetical protein
MTAKETAADAGRKEVDERIDGASLAAVLAAGIGALSVGLFVILNEAGLWSAPTVYGPAGGVSGRTTLAALAWAVAWAVLHWRWKDREIAARPVFVLTLVLVALGLVATFPPVWGVL